MWDITLGPAGTFNNYSYSFKGLANENTLYFVSRNGYLWRSDGTKLGTQIVKDYPLDCSAFQGDLFCVGYDSTIGAELWKSDSTWEGTQLLLDIYPGEESSYPYNFSPLGDVMLFFAEDATHGNELWRTDGTTAGTWLVKDINPDGDGIAFFGYYD